ncbi:multicopper oxidase family protein [Sandaracinobacter neustonicus]|uniref:Multicopper oxidase family protein n=1 Tax=Sandaracinobacter neustonicus TaxID=1715348 RepID=A0A501XSQ4_9SPHN|nr:multicopper oxidase family protein [Sandaracinobacter neustonicus]TPE63701.1 multicopper oxidase family protein [Sandaracinobacter neustonicus]
MPALTRRTLLKSSLVAAAAAELGSAGAFAADTPETVLRLLRRTIEVNGKAASVYGIQQPDGTSGLTLNAGDRFRVKVENHIEAPSLLHWHGLTPPWQQDGVPGISGPPIAPGSSARYDFPLRSGGTFWMHSHASLQEPLMMSAPLIIHDDRDRADEQEIVLMLHDFSFTSPEEIFASLRKPKTMAPMAPMQDMAAPGKAAPDLNDVKFDAFLANDRTLADPEIVKAEPGGRIRLRVINAAAMSNFHFDLGALTGELIAVDGSPVVPVKARRFPLAVAQRLDIRLTLPKEAATYPLLALLEGTARQTGLILRAGNAPVQRVADMAGASAQAVTLDLESRLRATKPLKPRKADRVHTINLTGDMANYIWSINGVPWSSDVPPLPVAPGERVELALVNKTGMAHPMHLHGHTFQVVEIGGQRFSGAMRDTVLVPPNGRVVLAFDADNPGWWAFHCHMIYHLAAGMFTTIRYV